MARHASPRKPTARRALIALATTGAALGAGAAAASAAPAPLPAPVPAGDLDPQAGLGALTGPLGYATGPLAGLKPNPLAGTGVDPLDNGVATQLADFKPLSTKALTGPIAQADSIGSLPVVGQVTGLLGGVQG